VEGKVVNLNDKKLELMYPCNWNYKVIIHKECDIKDITKCVFGEREHKVTKSNKSKNDKYQSYKVSTLVHNDDDRKELFEQLRKDKNVKIVL
jgi:putative lipoic acid-binding regulatory protein